MFFHCAILQRMSDAVPLKPATPEDLPRLPFTLRSDGITAEIVAKRLAGHLQRSGFVVMQRPTEIGGLALGRGFEG
jgi:hypothetical protein